MIPGKRYKHIRGPTLTNWQRRQPAKEFRFWLVKRPTAVKYARVYIWWANRCSVFKSELVSSTQVIKDSDPADKSDTVLKTKEGRIHNRRRGYEMVGRIIVARRRHHDYARRAATLKARDALMRMSVGRIVSAVGAGNARRLR
jgi:hypothetical protein